MKTVNQEHFDKAAAKMKELRIKYPKMADVSEMAFIMMRINNPTSPIYDSEERYLEQFRRFEELLGKL